MSAPASARFRLLEAMIGAIWESSYGTSSVERICERADVRKGSFYHFFKSKTALAIAALDHLWETESRPNLDRIFSHSQPPLSRIERLLEHGYRKTLECRAEHGRVLGCPYFNIGAEIASAEPELAAKVREILDAFQGYLEAALRDARDAGVVDIRSPDETAACLFSMLEGASTQARIHNDPERVRHFADAFSRVIGAELNPDLEEVVA
ncbi:TetR/AcrR family transcriptional regulator [Haloferula sp. A504]|uniref:TetR/AcrR family transcriptional regulator n=1 Tax=Haloferula sp. A504 TaxID=3373601 RepID=UPI0031BE6FCD|nr:TetR/AcrR family transcriptional regulator [Verrucomicrobiaceae bacterium E54]